MIKIKDIINDLAGVTLGTWVRLTLLIVSPINMALQSCGVQTIPIDNEQITATISIAFAVISALTAYWKNNSFTAAAQAADAALRGEASVTFYNADERGCD